MDEAEYAARIAAAADDPTELGRIADELQGVPGSSAAAMRLRAIGLSHEAASGASCYAAVFR